MSKIVGLSLTQPWATLMAIGAKRIETRSWSTLYRGLVAIQAAKKFPAEAREFCREDAPYFHLTHVHGWEAEDLPLGAIVAVGRLADCRPTTYDLRTFLPGVWSGDLEDEERFGDYSPGRFAWLFRNIVAVDPPIPSRGALGLWNVPDDIQVRLRSPLPVIPEPDTTLRQMTLTGQVSL